MTKKLRKEREKCEHNVIMAGRERASDMIGSTQRIGSGMSHTSVPSPKFISATASENASSIHDMRLRTFSQTYLRQFKEERFRTATPDITSNYP